MLYFRVASIGMLIALMVAFFGGLAGHLGLFEVSFIVHATGLAILVGAMFFKGVGLKAREIPFYFFLTGMIGAVLTASDAYVVSAIGVTLAVAVSTLAQVTGSILIDSLGLGHLNRVPFNWKRLGSLSLLVGGILVMVLAP